MGRALSPEVKLVIYKVAEYFKKRKADKESFEYKYDANIAKIVAEATGYSEKTVRNVIAAGKSSMQDTGQLKFSPPKKPKVIKKKHVIDNSELELIRKKIHQFYETEKTVPSIRKLLASLREDGILNCGREYLRNLLHTMGYSFKQSGSKGHLLIEPMIEPKVEIKTPVEIKTGVEIETGVEIKTEVEIKKEVEDETEVEEMTVEDETEVQVKTEPMLAVSVVYDE